MLVKKKGESMLNKGLLVLGVLNLLLVGVVTVKTVEVQKNVQEISKKIVSLEKKPQAPQQRPAQPDPKQQLENDLKNKKEPVIEVERIVGGQQNKDKVVVYTDLQCPFCKRGHENLKQLMKSKKVDVVIKHLPLPMHPQAPLAAEYYELIALQSSSKAFSWLDLVFEDQRNITESILEEKAKKVGINVSRLKKDRANVKVMEKIQERIKNDMQEASSFGIRGTPGFNINGVLIRGAYPLNYLEEVLEKSK